MLSSKLLSLERQLKENQINHRLQNRPRPEELAERNIQGKHSLFLSLVNPHLSPALRSTASDLEMKVKKRIMEQTYSLSSKSTVVCLHVLLLVRSAPAIQVCMTV